MSKKRKNIKPKRTAFDNLYSEATRAANSETVSMGVLVPLRDDELSNASVRTALDRTEGIICDAAILLGVRRHVLEAYISKSPELKAIVDDYLHTIIDLSEKTIREAAKSGDYGAAMFIATTLGKDRGYSQKEELSINKRPKELKDHTLEELQGLQDAMLESMAKSLSTEQLTRLLESKQK